MSDIWGFKTQGQLYHQLRPSYPPKLCQNALNGLKQRKKYLDIGVGTGKTLFLFCEQFEQSLGIDVSDSMLNNARLNVQQFINNREKDNKNMSITIKKMGVEKLDELDDKYDLITAGEALFYFPGQETLRKIKKRLNKGGIFVALSYHLSGLQDLKDDVYFKHYINMITPYYAFDLNDLATHYTDSKKYPLNKVFGKVERQYARHYVEMTKEELIMSLKTYAGCNICLAKTGVDPTNVILQGIQSQKVVFRYECSRIICHNLDD